MSTRPAASTITATATCTTSAMVNTLDFSRFMMDLWNGSQLVCLSRIGLRPLTRSCCGSCANFSAQKGEAHVTYQCIGGRDGADHAGAGIVAVLVRLQRLYRGLAVEPADQTLANVSVRLWRDLADLFAAPGRPLRPLPHVRAAHSVGAGNTADVTQHLHLHAQQDEIRKTE